MDDGERRVAVRRSARAADPDRALAALFAPRDARDDLFALYAFNAELARIAGQVTEPGLGDIRLQWWRDAIEHGGEGAGHPVADAFGDVLNRRSLSRERIAGMIDARSFDVGATDMADAPALDAYLSKTAGNIFALAAEILGAKGETLERAIKAAGEAYGLTGLMRSLPLHASQGRIDFPPDALARHGVSPQAILAGETSAGLEALLAEMRDRARGALHDAKAHVAGLDDAGRTAFVPLSLVEPYLASLEKVRDPFREIATINPLARLWRLARSSLLPRDHSALAELDGVSH